MAAVSARYHDRAPFKADPVALADAAYTSPWSPTHRQLVDLAIEVAHARGWLVTVTHDSRGEAWSADSGWPDVFAVPEPTIVSRRGRAVAIEIKVPPDDLTAEQTRWWVALSAVPGIDAVVFRSCGDRARDMATLAELLR